MQSKSCPYCKKKTLKKDNPYWPFCSERCKLIDLGQWASGKYSIPGESIRSHGQSPYSLKSGGESPPDNPVSKEDEDDDEGKNNVD
ncbi:MAG: DNA gyrase inhibitor YacG [Deltaproteobacteria bacterium]|nr:DNA gyrase inhibitor YacG [Deltaproteobacteria bacterium]